MGISYILALLWIPVMVLPGKIIVVAPWEQGKHLTSGDVDICDHSCSTCDICCMEFVISMWESAMC